MRVVPLVVGASLLAAALQAQTPRRSAPAERVGRDIVVSATAANALSNPNFDTDISGWTASSSSSVVLDFAAGVGNPSPGAARLSNLTELIADFMEQCVGVTGGSDYAALGRFQPSGYTPSGNSFGFEVSWYASSDCSGSPLGLDPDLRFRGAGTPDGTWFLLDCSDPGVTSPCRPFTAPASALSALVRVGDSAEGAAGNSLYIDTLQFVTPPVPVELQSVAVE